MLATIGLITTAKVARRWILRARWHGIFLDLPRQAGVQRQESQSPTPQQQAGGHLNHAMSR